MRGDHYASKAEAALPHSTHTSNVPPLQQLESTFCSFPQFRSISSSVAKSTAHQPKALARSSPRFFANPHPCLPPPLSHLAIPRPSISPLLSLPRPLRTPA